jgi:hypothetical protein
MTKGSDFQIWESDHQLWDQEFCFDIFARQLKVYLTRLLTRFDPAALLSNVFCL